MRLSPIIRFCRLLTVLLAVAATCGEAELRAAEKWRRLSSEHFDMLSCTGERDSKLMLVRLEQFRAFFFKLFPAGRAHDMRPLIFVFDTPKQFEKYTPLRPNGKTQEIGGVFLSSPTECRIAMVHHDLGEGLRVIFHEYVHALVRARMTGTIPTWFNEGIAEVYSTFEVIGDNFEFGRTQRQHVRTMSRTPLIPFSTFFAVDGSSKYYNENDKANIFYAQAWLLMHFIMCGKNESTATTSSISKFIDLYDMPGIKPQDAFQQSFGMDYEKLQNLLDNYLREGTYTKLAGKMPAKTIRDKIVSRPATRLECDIELEGLRWRIRNTEDSAYKLEQLLEKQPDDPRIYEILAEIKMRGSDPFEDADYRRKAVEKNTSNALVYVRRLRDEFRGASYPLGYTLPPETCATYRNLVDKALELSPDCMEAYEMLALVESISPTIRIAKMNAVLEALQYMRKKNQTCLALATAYWRLKQYDSAEDVITELKNDPKATNAEKRKADDILRRIAKDTGKSIPPPPPPA